MPSEVKTPACTFLEVHPARLLPVKKDLRTRDGSGYRMFFDNLVADIHDRGVQQPIITHRELDRFRVIEGETRRRAALIAGSDSVPILVHETEPSPADLLVAQVQANGMRLDISDLESARVFQELMTVHGWSQAEVAARLHIAPSEVSKKLTISKALAPALQERVTAGTLAPAIAYPLTRLKDHGQQIDLADLAAAQSLNRAAVEEKVKQLLGSKPAKAKPVAVRVGRGVQAVLPAGDFDAILSDLGTLAEAVRRAQKLNLPLSAVPSLLKG